MPFIGKFSVQPVLTWAYKSPPDEKLARIFAAILFLLFFIAAHTNQAYFGWRIFLATDVFAFQAFAACYAIANMLVVYTQIYLLFRLLVHATRFNKGRMGQVLPTRFDYQHFMVCLIFTGTGQLMIGIIGGISLR